MFGSSSRVGGLPARLPEWPSVAASLSGLVLGHALSWPLWATTLSMVLPWLPLFTRWTTRTYRTHVWLGFFFLLTALQLSHFGEHVVQMVQIHLLDLQGDNARGVFGVFDVEWVHFIWNGCVLVGVVLLLPRHPRSHWLQLAAVIPSWHAVEHTYIMHVYLTTGVSGTPGLLAS